MWTKYVTRRLAVQVAQAWNFGFGEAMKKIYGICIKNTLVFRDNKKTEYYVDDRQHKIYVSELYGLLNNSKFIKIFHKKAQEKLEDILNKTCKRLDQNLLKLSNKELLRIYKNFILPNTAQFYVRMWTVFNIGEPLANVVMDNLKEYVDDEKRRTEYLLSLSSPLVSNDVLNERIDILKLALLKKKLNRADFLKRIKAHAQKYQHIPMFDFDHKPYNEEHFLQEIKSIKDPKNELFKLEELFTNRQKGFNQILKIIRPNKKFKNLLQFLKENVFLRDWRDMIRQKLNLELRKFYEEIGKRLGLNVEEIAVLTNEEIIRYLKANKKFSKKEVKKRKTAYLLIQEGDKVKIYSGTKAKMAAKKELNIGKLKKIKLILGIIGSKGKACGIVKIVYTNRDLYKVKEGEILVTAMTRQDFVPAIRKAVALVTDEGGITCHAAIIARELKKPCLVATKIATKVLRDGDKVEVDAERGVVIKVLK